MLSMSLENSDASMLGRVMRGKAEKNLERNSLRNGAEVLRVDDDTIPTPGEGGENRGKCATQMRGLVENQ